MLYRSLMSSKVRRAEKRIFSSLIVLVVEENIEESCASCDSIVLRP